VVVIITGEVDHHHLLIPCLLKIQNTCS